MTEAVSLPDRRLSITERLLIGPPGDETELLVGVGFAPDGTAREVFLSGHKIGSEMEALMDDACILASKLLQSDPAREMAADLAEALRGPASLLSRVLEKAAVLEREAGTGIREAYAAAAATRRKGHALRRLRTGEAVR